MALRVRASRLGKIEWSGLFGGPEPPPLPNDENSPILHTLDFLADKFPGGFVFDFGNKC